jgi:hypothetical protein
MPSRDDPNFPLYVIEENPRIFDAKDIYPIEHFDGYSRMTGGEILGYHVKEEQEIQRLHEQMREMVTPSPRYAIFVGGFSSKNTGKIALIYRIGRNTNE